MAADQAKVPFQPAEAVVHPVVLLSVVDHYNRVAKDTNKRIVGTLLGEVSRDGVVDVRNSFAVPFEEETKDTNVFFLDHNFHEQMFGMFKKVNAKEKVVGWYHSGPKIRESDMKINEIFRKYVKDPVMVIVDVKPKEVGLPVESYFAVDEIKEDGTESRRTFQHIPSKIEALEAEEVGVEHLLRDVKDTTLSSLTNDVSAKLNALRGLKERLEEMKEYVDNVTSGKIPANHDIIAQLQDIFNLLPNLQQDELVKAFAVKTNDQMVVVYLASLIRSIVALHNLINNKILQKEHEAKLEEEDKAGDEKKADAKKEDEKKKEEGKGKEEKK